MTINYILITRYPHYAVIVLIVRHFLQGFD